MEGKIGFLLDLVTYGLIGYGVIVFLGLIAAIAVLVIVLRRWK